MLLKKAQPFQAQAPPSNSVKGIYMTKENRIETRNETTKTHFNIGSKEVSKSLISINLLHRVP